MGRRVQTMFWAEHSSCRLHAVSGLIILFCESPLSESECQHVLEISFPPKKFHCRKRKSNIESNLLIVLCDIVFKLPCRNLLLELLKFYR